MNTNTGGFKGFAALNKTAESQKTDDQKVQEARDNSKNEPLDSKQKGSVLADDSVGVSAANNVASEEQVNRAAALFTSHPIMRLKLGKFQFDRGLLTIEDSEDAAEFKKMLDKLPARDRNQIREISVDAAERLVRPIEPGVTTQFDSSVGRQRETLATGDKTVGTEPLEGLNREQFAKGAQTDNNAPIAGTADKQVVNESNQGDVQTQEKVDEQKKINEQG